MSASWYLKVRQEKVTRIEEGFFTKSLVGILNTIAT